MKLSILAFAAWLTLNTASTAEAKPLFFNRARSVIPHQIRTHQRHRHPDRHQRRALHYHSGTQHPPHNARFHHRHSSGRDNYLRRHDSTHRRHLKHKARDRFF